MKLLHIVVVVAVLVSGAAASHMRGHGEHTAGGFFAAPAPGVTYPPCCEKACPEGQAKYYSINKLFNMCGESCIDPSKQWPYKIFEPGLTRSNGTYLNPCPHIKSASAGYGYYSEYSYTAVHGWSFFNVTVDLYKAPKVSL